MPESQEKYRPLKRFLLLFLLLLAAAMRQSSFAQDTLFRYYPEFTKYYLLNHLDTARSIDTSITHFNRKEPAEKPFGHLYLGHVGAASNTMFFVAPRDAGINIGFHQYDLNWRNLDEVKFYNTQEPYTSFGYMQGAKAEIYASVVHTQNITPALNIGIDFNRMRGNGWY